MIKDKVLQQIKTYLLALFYPRICTVCGARLSEHEKAICLPCGVELPVTNFHTDKNNTVAQLFWGKINVEFAASYFYFTKGSRFQEILHSLKYRNNLEVGEMLGEQYARIIQHAIPVPVDVIVPVPLYIKRLKERGYNQSEIIARGFSLVLNVPVNTTAIKRIKNTKTQTSRSKYARYQNMKDVFCVINPDEITGKHILLVDDVITTGSTIESCASELVKVQGTKVSIVSLAYASLLS